MSDSEPDSDSEPESRPNRVGRPEPSEERPGRFKRIFVIGVTAVLVFVGALFTLLHSLGVVTLVPGFRPSPVKIMIVGDSISHGYEGDFTWRYRLWEWLRESSVAVQFVGPYLGTFPPDDVLLARLNLPYGGAVSALSPEEFRAALDADADAAEEEARTWGGYAAEASPDFDSAHFALWGRQAHQAKGLISEQVMDYQPDYLLVELGFNDVGWFRGVEDTLASMKAIIDNARTWNPELKFAIANVPHRTRLDNRPDLPLITDEYNARLEEALLRWSTFASPVELVRFREAYSCGPDSCPAAHDGLHPNELGDYQIAQAFSRTLVAKFGLGQRPLSVPADIPARPCPAPEDLDATPTMHGINTTWPHVYGAYGYDLQARHRGSHWLAITFQSAVPHYDARWAADGKEWQFRVRTNCGDKLRSAWSNVASASAPVPPPAVQDVL